MSMASGNTVRCNGLVMQIPASRDRYHFAKATIRVLEYHDGGIALFHGPRKIARFLANGREEEGEAFRCSIPDVSIDERRLPLFIARATLRGLIAVLEARATGDSAR